MLNREVRFALKNRHRLPGLSGPKSAMGLNGSRGRVLSGEPGQHRRCCRASI